MSSSRDNLSVAEKSLNYTVLYISVKAIEDIVKFF